MQIAIIGAGNVRGALGEGWARAGHAIADGVPDPSDDKHRATVEAARGAGPFSVARAVQRAEVIALAVPFDSVDSALAAAGDLGGRLLIDGPTRCAWVRMGWSCRLVLTGRPPSMCGSARAKCGGVQDTEPSRVKGHAKHGRLCCAAGDAGGRRRYGAQAHGGGLVADLGFHPVDAGDLRVARLLEPYDIQWIHMALDRMAGRDNAFV